MIDPQKETLISFAEAAKLFASYRQGKPAHYSRLHRYRLYGHRGVFLEAIRQGGSWATSREAVARFMSALTPLFAKPGSADEESKRPMTPEPAESGAPQRRRLERTERELAARGVS